MSLLSSSTTSSLLKLNPLAPIHAAMGTIVTSQITPRVFVADWLVASNWDALDALGVTHVVSVCEIPPIVLGRQGHMHVCIVDLPFADISTHFEKTTKFIRDALSKEGTKVLVHCLGGLSRSISVVCAWLIAAKGLTANQSIVYSKACRSIAHPNQGFRHQLRGWAAKHGLHDEDDDDSDAVNALDAEAKPSRLGITSRLSKSKLPGSGLLGGGLVRKMVSDSVGRLSGHGGNESEVLQIARVKALGPDWEGSATVVTHATVLPNDAVKVDVAVI